MSYNNLKNQILPFIVIGVVSVALVFGVVLLAYLLFIGAIFGIILYSINWIRNKFWPKPEAKKPTRRHGRVIDSDDWKHL